MNQIYFKNRYLFILLSFFACSVGMAQSPLQNKQNGNLKTAVGPSVVSQTKEQDSNKTGNPNSNHDDTNNLFTQKEEKIPGKELSQEESEAVKKQLKQSQNLFGQKLTNTTEKTNPQDSDSTKVRSFVKLSDVDHLFTI